MIEEMMNEEQIEQLAYKHSCDDDEPLFSFSRRDLSAFAGALLAASTASDKQEASWAPERIWLQRGVGEEGSHTWCEHQIGEDSIGDAIEEAGYVRVYAAPLAQSAEQDSLFKALVLARDCMTANGLDATKVPRTFHIIDAAIAKGASK
jgi:hypothetical protein